MASLTTTIVRRFPGIIYRQSLGSYQCIRLVSSSDSAIVTLDGEPEHTEKEIEQIQNKSKLEPHHFRMYRGLCPQIPENERRAYQKTLKWERKMIGTYGFTSEHDPGICFITKSEMEDLIEYEKVAFDVPLLEIRKRELDKLSKMKKERYEREKKITEALAKQEEWKETIRARMKTRLETVQQAQAERAKLLEDVRRFFGYTIDPKDQRFQVMLALKEREVAKQKRQAKKKEKEEAFMAKLASLEVPTDMSTSQKAQTNKENE